MTSVTIPNSVTSIGAWAFEDCDALTSVTIGDGVTSIEKQAFYDCQALTSVTIGDGVTSIKDKAFSHCDALTSFYCHAQNPPTLYDYVFYDNYKGTLYVPARCGSKYRSSRWNSYFINIIEMD